MRRVILAIALAASPLLADEVHLKGGGRLSGEIVGHTEDSVTVDIGAGKMTVKLSTVVRIEEGSSPLQQYRERAANLAADDVEAWRELGRWAADEGLSKQSREAWSRVVAIAPDDPEANRALGLVEHDGRWVTEAESYGARGFVEFEGEWMKPEERQAIQEDRRTRDEADQKALAAQIEADEVAAREREAKEAAEWEEKSGSDLPMLGDPVPWGWGAGRRTGPRSRGVRSTFRGEDRDEAQDDEQRETIGATTMRGATAMRRFLVALPLLGALFGACSSPPPVAEVDEVDEIVDSNLAARGGKERLKALRAIRETGTVHASDGRVARVVREISGPASSDSSSPIRERPASSRTTAPTPGRSRRCRASSSLGRCRPRPRRRPSTSATSRVLWSTGARRVTS